VRETLAEIRSHAYRMREMSLDDWEFEIEIRPQFFTLMEAEFWEPKAIEAFAEIKPATTKDSDWMNEILGSVGEPLDLKKYRTRVSETLEDVEQVTLSEMVDRYPLERGVVEIVCYRVIAGEDPKHEILSDQLIQIDLNRPAQPRFVEVQQLIFQRNRL
jgi:hypothetical protein